jgi:hypothetical protein
MERSQASQTEPDGSDLDEGFTAGWQPLIIASQAAVADQPAKSALDFPTMTLDLKASFRQNPQDWLAINEHPLLM